MIYKQKLTKIGNSVGLVIPKEVRDILNLSEKSELFLEARPESGSLVLNIEKPSSSLDSQFYELVRSIDDQYSDALEKLAKH